MYLQYLQQCQVPEVRVRGGPLAAEGHRARPRLRPLQPGLLLSIPRLCPHRRQRDEEVCSSHDNGNPDDLDNNNHKVRHAPHPAPTPHPV